MISSTNGRRSGRSGFTLLELIVTVTVVGVLTAISVTLVSNNRDRAYYTAMRADLSRLAKAEETYWASGMGTRRGPRYGRLGQLRRTVDFVPTTNVTLNVRASASGWSARARHSGLGRRQQCAMYVGSGARPFPPAQRPGVIECR